MTDKDVQRVLDEGYEIASVLMARGGWIRAPLVEVACRFPADEAGPALWMIDLYSATDPEPWHVLYVKAESIVGISCRRNPEERQT